ncbi:MAG: family 10 glycosylhydrolase [Bacteroidaceae bacterium]|nr:family 10 glycosylhydrolase [Bacteroidaceae bacterium]
MKRMAPLLLLLQISCVCLAQPLWNIGYDAPKRELRAVWVTTLSGLDWPRTKATSKAGIERQKQELCELLDQLKATNVNTVLLQTRIRGSLIYPSQLEPWDICLTGQYDKHPGYDPLQFAIEETHRRGMELHAWVVTIPAFKIEVAKKMGKKSLLSTHPSLLLKHNGQYYLDPGQPGTADYLSAILADFIDRYDVDGIHFDYIRYPENANTFPDGASYQKYGQKQPKAQWRRDNITRIVRRLYGEVKARKPWVVMSSSPVGKYRDTRRYSSKGWNAYDAVHQDAQGWLREGIQDALFPMMYFTGDHFYPFAADWQEGTYGRYVAPGLGIYFLHPGEKNWNLSVITRELCYLRQEGLAGQAMFRARFLTENTKGLRDYLQHTFWAYPALPPRYTWTDSIAPHAPEGFTVEQTDNQTSVLHWSVPQDEATRGGLRYNIYASTTYPVSTTPENLVAMLQPEPRYTFNRLTTRLFGLHLAVTAIDRSGNESPAAQLELPRSRVPQRIPLNPLGRPVVSHLSR